LKRNILPAVGMLLVYAAALFGWQDSGTKVKPATIEGIVTKSGTGEPLRDVRVTVTGAGVDSVTTNAEGRFRIADLAPGAYNLDASATLFVPTRKNNLYLNLSPDQHLRDVNIQLTPAAVITGRVYDQNRRPLPALHVEALRYQYRDGAKVLIWAGSGQSDDRGEYRIYNLQPGTYYVRATPSATSLQAALAPAFYPGVVDLQDGVPITVAAGTESSAIDISLGGTRTFSVRVKIAAAFPNVGASFAAVRLGRGMPESIILHPEPLGDGAYRISPFTPGAYDIFAQVQTPASEFTQTGRISVNIANQDVEAGILAVRPSGSLSGRLIASEPLSVAVDPANIGIALRPTAGSPSILATNSRNLGGGMTSGVFTIPNVANGRFRIEVSGLPADVYLTSARYGGAEVIDSGIDVDGAPQGPLDLYLGGAGSVGTIKGVVKSRNDQPAGNSVVVIAPAPNRRENPAAFRTAITDQVGVFSVRGLLPGEYTILAWEDVEANAYQNPQFLADSESSGVKATVERGSSKVVDVRVIPRSDQY